MKDTVANPSISLWYHTKQKGARKTKKEKEKGENKADL